jgi:uncharacterized alkaline shock family protein YloU
MTVELRSPGQTTVAPDVLLSIARLTALGIPGVVVMGKAPLWTRESHTSDGVRLQIEDGVVDLDLYLILAKDTNLRQVARQVQETVAEAVSKMIGMQPGRINVHIEDIFYPETT